MENIKSTITT